MTARHNPLHCIVPPYMLKEIVENGTPAQKEWAAKTLAVTDQMQVHRKEVVKEAPRPTPQVATAVPGKQRVVYDGQNGSSLPGVTVRSEGDAPVADAAVNEAYDGAGETYDLYATYFGRNSIDNNGMRLDSTVHHLQSYDNAFWNGQQMVYGDGDEDLPVNQRIFNRFTIAIDVIGHELTHGVVQYTANLQYAFQPGALNESFADVFGAMVKQQRLNQTVEQADWVIGAGLFTSNVNAVGIRSMKMPGTAYDDPVLGKDPQPAHMDKYVNTFEDNGGVHINSGIPNRAFYETAMLLGGYSWQKAGQIWYGALTGALSANADFQTAANLLFTTAGQLYGVDSPEQQAVRTGWGKVGITVGGDPVPPPTPDNPGCLSSVLGIFRRRPG